MNAVFLLDVLGGIVRKDQRDMFENNSNLIMVNSVV